MKTKKYTQNQKRALENCLLGASYEITARKMSTRTKSCSVTAVVYALVDFARTCAQSGDIKVADLLDKHY